jgi:hypothetical protein
MVAVRNHHVFVLISHVDGSNWLVHDGNSGHGLTHEHVRSIKGYTVVDLHIGLSADRMTAPTDRRDMRQHLGSFRDRTYDCRIRPKADKGGFWPGTVCPLMFNLMQQRNDQAVKDA